MKKIILTFAIITLALSSCKKKESETPADDHHDHEVTVSYNSILPEEGDTIYGGTSIPITGSITASAAVHGYLLTIKNHDTDVLLYSNEVHEHSASYTINDLFIHSLVDTTELYMKFNVAVDHDGTMSNKEVHLVYVP